MKKIFILLTCVSILGVGCTVNKKNFAENKTEFGNPKDIQIKQVQEELMKRMVINPIEFSCNQKLCLITEASRKLSGLDPSNSTCIWTVVGGSAQVPIHMVTERGIHMIDSYSADSVLCQNETGEVFFGDSATEIMPKN